MLRLSPVHKKSYFSKSYSILSRAAFWLADAEILERTIKPPPRLTCCQVGASLYIAVAPSTSRRDQAEFAFYLNSLGLKTAAALKNNLYFSMI